MRPFLANYHTLKKTQSPNIQEEKQRIESEPQYVNPKFEDGGRRMIPITVDLKYEDQDGTEKIQKRQFNVWTQKFGNNPKIKVLMLHGGPGASHELYHPFESFFPQNDIEFYYYNQLGSIISDNPDNQVFDDLWTIPRFVDEVEQVRIALGLNKDNFYIFGNSWGGILALEYAFKYQENLKALIVCTMVSSSKRYDNYMLNTIAPKAFSPEELEFLYECERNRDYNNEKYEKLLFDRIYLQHTCRIDPWPKSLTDTLDHLNQHIYIKMNGPNEFGIKGTLKTWDRDADLHKLKVPTLTIGAKYDTMNPEDMKWMAEQIEGARNFTCENGSHLCFWDEQEFFFENIIKFIKDVDQQRFYQQQN